MESEFTILVDDGVAGIAAALKPHHNVGIFRQHIGDFTLSLVAPAGAYDRFDHNSSSLSYCYSWDWLSRFILFATVYTVISAFSSATNSYFFRTGSTTSSRNSWVCTGARPTYFSGFTMS